MKLPDSDIIVVHRSDGSGTSYIFTDYLNKVSREWKDKVGFATSVNWPVGLGGKGNEGVTQQVKQTEGAIGYVELIYAASNNLRYAEVKNAAGKFVEPSLESVTAAAASAKFDEEHRFPGLDHQRARRGRVSDRVVHLAAGAAGHEGPGQGEGSQGFPQLDDHAEAQKMADRAAIRAAAGGGRGADRGAAADAQGRWQGDREQVTPA